MKNSASLGKPDSPARVLSIAGSDPSGGAGIQADIKSISAAGGYAMTAITALTAQNTQGVDSIHVPPANFLAAQLSAIAADIDIDGIKIGMLGSADLVAVVSDFLDKVSAPVVLDPVMVATSGDRLLDQEAEAAVRELCTKATIITPNVKELAVLTQTPEASTLDEAIAVATKWAQSTQVAVLVKGGHLDSEQADNAVVLPTGQIHRFPCPRVETTSTHGTGCSLSSALATRIALGESLPSAVKWSTQWVREAIMAGRKLNVGKGHGPIDHGFRARHMAQAASTALAPALRINADAAQLHVEPQGSHSHVQALRDMAASYLTEILELPFIVDLGSGDLDADDFAFYISQDSAYLGPYSSALLRLSVLAPSTADQAAWAHDAEVCLQEEIEMHKQWEEDEEDRQPSSVTAAYSNFLLAATHTDDYAVGTLAVLPCYWLYAEVGKKLAAHVHPQHPFKDWINTYSAQEFIDSARGAIERAEHALAAVNEETQKRALRAFEQACRYEVDFFDQAHRRF